MRETDGGDLQARLAALRDKYLGDVVGRVERAATLWRVATGGGADAADSLQRLRHIAHGIAGAGATFGYAALSETARELELLVDAGLGVGTLSASEVERGAAMIRRLQERTDELQSAAATDRREPAAAPSAKPPSRATAGLAPVPASVDTAAPSLPLVYILDDEIDAATSVAAQLEHFGYRVRTFVDRETLLGTIEAQMPDALVTDICLPDSRRGGIEIAQQLRQRYGDALPVVFMSVLGDIGTRLAAVRAGGQAYLEKPIQSGRLIDSLDAVTRRHPSTPYRVMIVEDDSHEADAYSAMLSSEGFEVALLRGAHGLLSTLTDFRPEVILLDLYLDDCTGFELASVIRQQVTSVGVPIIYLSAELDARRQLDAIARGGDGFITKPVTADYLVRRVGSYVQRARTVGRYLTRDSLTGALNHAELLSRVGNEVARARRDGTEMAFAMLDVDRFKSVNDTYGHQIGDIVLRSLANLLRGRLRVTDVVGRYGGEEFGVILPGAAAEAAAALLDELRQSFERIAHRHGDGEFHVTFSAGIAHFPTHDTADTVCAAADAAVYAAKNAGRNRVHVAPAPGDTDA